jgi:hypothetical protein
MVASPANVHAVPLACVTAATGEPNEEFSREGNGVPIMGTESRNETHMRVQPSGTRGVERE